MVGWIKMPLGTEVSLCKGDIVLDRDLAPHGKGHSSPSQKRGTAAPTFRLTSVVAKWSPISATAELLFINSAIKSTTLLAHAVFASVSFMPSCFDTVGWAAGRATA